MHVLLDTNIYLSDPSFTKPQFEALKNYLRRSNAKIILPETVKREVRKNLKKIAFNDTRKLKSLTSVRTGLIEQVPTQEQLEERLNHHFNTFIRSRHFEIGHENLNLMDLFVRSLDEKAPFKTEGRGFRDALIWGGLLHHLNTTENAQIAFISNNTSDFGTETLKPELLSELEELGHSGKVFYFNNLSTFLATYGRSIEFINDDFIETVLEDEIEYYADSIDENELDIDFPNREFEWEVDETDFQSYDIDSYYIFSADTTHYWISVNVTLNFNVYLSGRVMDWRPNYDNTSMNWEAVETEEIVKGTADHNWVISINKESHETEVLPF